MFNVACTLMVDPEKAIQCHNTSSFEFKRLQFTVQPAFAMTINKVQCQLLTVAGVDLTFHMLNCMSHCPVL